MEKLQEFYANLVNSGDLSRYALLALFLIVGSLLIGSAGRFVFGKRSLLGCSVSSAIAVVFLYALTAVLLAVGGKYAMLTAPLPCVTIANDRMFFFTFTGADFETICAQVLNLVILSFVVSLGDRFLPRGKNIFVWLLCRVLTVIFGLIAHLIVTKLLWHYLPEGISQYAPTVLLAILVLMIVTGALKLVIGFLIGTVDPVIGGLYTFFFANIIGRQLTRSAVTTALICALVFGLEKLGIASVGISMESLTLYIPYAAGLLGLWYFANRLF